MSISNVKFVEIVIFFVAAGFLILSPYLRGCVCLDLEVNPLKKLHLVFEIWCIENNFFEPLKNFSKKPDFRKNLYVFLFD